MRRLFLVFSAISLLGACGSGNAVRECRPVQPKFFRCVGNTTITSTTDAIPMGLNPRASDDFGCRLAPKDQYGLEIFGSGVICSDIDLLGDRDPEEPRRSFTTVCTPPATDGVWVLPGTIAVSVRVEDGGVTCW